MDSGKAVAAIRLVCEMSASTNIRIAIRAAADATAGAGAAVAAAVPGADFSATATVRSG
jgi:hypothetical protein